MEPWRIIIHRGIDGYSRLIVYIHGSTNNTASTVLTLFQEAVRKSGLPSRVRSDYGVENVDLATYVITRGLNRGAMITGRSVHNQRIESIWRVINTAVINMFKDVFALMESDGILDRHSEVDLYCLHFVFLPKINLALAAFSEQWKNHPMRTFANQSPRMLFMSGI